MIAENYTLAAAQKNAAPPPDEAPDSLKLSPAALREVALTGRVAANADSGNLTSDQSQQLYTQISSIHSQIAVDQKADGGTLSPTDAKAVQQAQTQLSQTVYSDAHNGATAPSDATVTQAGTREDVEAGRIVLNEKAGHLSGGQATQLGSELSGIQQQIAGDEQANGGTLSATDAQAINQLQSQLSQQIYNTAHSVATPNKTSG
jgi:hypothetical protein